MLVLHHVKRHVRQAHTLPKQMLSVQALAQVIGKSLIQYLREAQVRAINARLNTVMVPLLAPKLTALGFLKSLANRSMVRYLQTVQV